MTDENLSIPVAEQPTGAGRARRSRVPIIGAAFFLCALTGFFFWLRAASSLKEAHQAAAAGDVVAATRAFEQHLRTHPSDWNARLEYGAFLKQHDAAAALLILQQIPPTTTEFIPAVRHIAHIALVGRRDSLAEAALKKLCADNQNDFEAVQSLAQLYRRQEKNAEALPLVVKCVELKPGQIENHLLLAQIYYSVKRPSEMVEPLLKALKLDPENREAHLNLAFSYTLQGEYEKARQEAEWSREHDPENVHVWRVLSQIERDDANDELALRYLRRGLLIDPDEIECRILEGQILVFQKKFQEAYDRMLPVFQRQPREQRVVGVMAQATRFLGRTEEAAKFQKLSIELANENYKSGKKPGK